MPRKASDSTLAKKTAKKVNITIQAPGMKPEKLSVKDGYSVVDFAKSKKIELSDYVITVFGDSVGGSYVFKNGDEIRIGLKTKNN